MADQKGGKRDMMGSKADMISSKFDPVARNQIWREVLKKETMRTSDGENETFVLNPKTLTSVTPKVGEIPVIRDEDRENLGKLKEIVSKSTQPPQAKASFPRTSAEEVGWWWHEGERPEATHPKSSCKETKYAEHFVTMAGSNPFAKKTGVGR